MSNAITDSIQRDSDNSCIDGVKFCSPLDMLSAAKGLIRANIIIRGMDGMDELERSRLEDAYKLCDMAQEKLTEQKFREGNR